MTLNLLISDEVPDGELIEFKQRLPAKDGKLIHGVLEKYKIGDGARNKMLVEV